MKISIVTINLNNDKGLEQTILSILEQDYSSIELIIIDGASSDHSIDIIEKYRERISHWKSEKDTGVYNAQNKGIAQSTGDYLLFLNSGDYFYSRHSIKDLVNHGKNAEIIYGDMILKSENCEQLEKYPDRLNFEYFLNHTLPHPCTLISKHLFIKYGKYKEEIKICADWAFFLDMIGRYQVTYQHVRKEISVFCLGGLSSALGSKLLIEKERKDYVSKEYAFFRDGYDRLLESEKKLNDLKLSRYLKMISAFLPAKLRKILYE